MNIVAFVQNVCCFQRMYCFPGYAHWRIAPLPYMFMLHDSLPSSFSVSRNFPVKKSCNMTIWGKETIVHIGYSKMVHRLCFPAQVKYWIVSLSQEFMIQALAARTKISPHFIGWYWVTTYELDLYSLLLIGEMEHAKWIHDRRCKRT